MSRDRIKQLHLLAISIIYSTREYSGDRAKFQGLRILTFCKHEE